MLPKPDFIAWIVVDRRRTGGESAKVDSFRELAAPPRTLCLDVETLPDILFPIDDSLTVTRRLRMVFLRCVALPNPAAKLERSPSLLLVSRFRTVVGLGRMPLLPYRSIRRLLKRREAEPARGTCKLMREAFDIKN